MKHSQKFLQQRKFLMTAPVLVIPFLTLLFWALGGGQGLAVEITASAPAGLNFELPLAHFSEEDLDKMSLYEKARRDSMKFQEARDNDPYFKLDELEAGLKPLTGRSAKVSTDPNEIMVTSKLEELYRELNKKPTDISADAFASQKNAANPLGGKGTELRKNEQSEDLKQLGAMMEMMQSHRSTSPDPEESRINSMLDKILDIQHPERVKDRQGDQRASPNAFAVVTAAPQTSNTFFGLDEELSAADSANAIEAIVHSTQELVAGSTVKMRLLRDVFIDGHAIEKDRFVYGTASINGERLMISVASIRDDNSLYPVKLDAFDLDGLEGIYVPGAITRDAAKQSSDQAMQSMQFMTMDQSLGAQAGAAGIQAAKGLFSKKVKLVRVTVKAGYRILLRDERR